MATILKNSVFNLCVAKIRISPLTVFKTGKILSNFTTSRLILGSNSLGFRKFHLTRHVFGIEEFFPSGVLETNEPLPEEVLSGRSWRATELRQKSNEDLHKLWYVLLKERNMLLTVQWEARRQEVVMPSPQRLHKVKKSMAMIKVVIGEREKAIESIKKDIKERQSKLDLIKGDNEEQQGMLEEHKESGKHLNQVPIAT